MAQLSISELMKNQDFLGLPETEKAKVLETILPQNSDFSNLPESEKITVMNKLVSMKPAKATPKGRLMGNLDQMEQKQAGLVSDVQQAASNIPESAANLASGLAQAVAHPIDTAKSLLDVAAGGIQNILPKSVVNYVNKQFPSQSAAEAQDKAKAVAHFFIDRYGSPEAVRQTLVKDPVGALADASTFLTGAGGIVKAGGAAAKFDKLAKVGEKLQRAGTVAEPLNLAYQTGKAGAGVARKGAQVVAGAVALNKAKALEAAYEAGRQGNEALVGAMRGDTAIEDVLVSLEDNVRAIRDNMQQYYRSGMEDISKDAATLKFDNIDKSVKAAAAYAYHKGDVTGPVKNERAAEVLRQLQSKVDEWKKLGADYHNVEGFDTLKQQIWAEIEKIPREDKTARAMAMNVYNSVRSSIVQQAPKYAALMKDYEQTSNMLKQTNKIISAAPDANISAQLGKLQTMVNSGMKDQRIKMLKNVEDLGGIDVTGQLAGLSLSTWKPEVINKVSASIPGAIAAFSGGPVIGGLYGAMSSPRLMGETFYGMGQAAKGVGAAEKAVTDVATKAGMTPEQFVNVGYQLGNVGNVAGATTQPEPLSPQQNPVGSPVQQISTSPLTSAWDTEMAQRDAALNQKIRNAFKQGATLDQIAGATRRDPALIQQIINS